MRGVSGISIDPPTIQAEELTLELIEGLFPKEQVEIVADFERPTDLLYGGSYDVLEWVISVPPASVWEWLVVFLSGYTGKEFLKGFAGDAGKDFWLAAKSLALRISRHTILKSEAKEQITFSSKIMKLGDPGFFLTFPPVLFDDRGNNLAADILEGVLLPAVASFLDRHGAYESEEHQAFGITIRYVIYIEAWCLTIRQLDSQCVGRDRVFFDRVNFWLMTQEKLINWYTPDGKMDDLSGNLLDELTSRLKGWISSGGPRPR